MLKSIYNILNGKLDFQLRNAYLNILGKLFGRGLNFLFNLVLVKFIFSGVNFGSFALFYSFFRFISYFLSLNIGIYYYQDFKTKIENRVFFFQPFGVIFINILICYIICFVFNLNQYLLIINASALFALLRGLIDYTRITGKIIYSVLYEEVYLNVLMFIPIILFGKNLTVEVLFIWYSIVHLILLFFLFLFYIRIFKVKEIDFNINKRIVLNDYKNLISLTIIRGETFVSGFFMRDIGSKIYGLVAIGELHIVLMIVSTIHFFFQSYLVGIQNEILNLRNNPMLAKLYKSTKKILFKFTFITIVGVFIFHIINSYISLIVFGWQELIFVGVNVIIISALSQKITFLTYLNSLKNKFLNICLLALILLILFNIHHAITINLFVWVTLIINSNYFITFFLNLNNQILSRNKT